MSVTTENTSHSYAILVPDGCENLSGVTRATLEIGYPDRVTQTLTATRIQLENVPSGRDVEVLTSELLVQIFGTAEALHQVSAEDVVVTADLSDYAVASGTGIEAGFVYVCGAVFADGIFPAGKDVLRYVYV